MFISKLDFLRNLTNKVVSRTGADAFADVLREIIVFFAADQGCIYLFNSNDQILPLAFYPQEITEARLSEDFRSYITNLNQVIFYTDDSSYIEQEWQREILNMGYGTIVFVPLWKQDEITGFMFLAWKEKHQFKLNDDNLLYTIGNLLGIGLFNAHLIGGIQVREDELQTMCRALLKVKEEEAKRISRELHDEVGQDLTTIIIRLKMILGQNDVDNIHDDVKDLLFMVRETLADVQRIAMNLRPSALDNLGLLPAINWQLDQFRADSQLEIAFHHPHKLDYLTEEQELLLYRVLLEILTNVSRHSQATKAAIDLRQEEDSLILRVEDNGIGFDPEGKHTLGLGLIGMKERIKEQNGTFLLDSRIGEGTTITVTIPIQKAGGMKV